MQSDGNLPATPCYHPLEASSKHTPEAKTRLAGLFTVNPAIAVIPEIFWPVIDARLRVAPLGEDLRASGAGDPLESGDAHERNARASLALSRARKEIYNPRGGAQLREPLGGIRCARFPSGK